MELYVKVTFWLHLFVLIVSVLGLVVFDFPRTKKESVGQAAASAIVAGAFVFWTASILWG